MSETVTVKSFGEGRPWSSGDGKINLTFYECVFDRNGQDFTATWNKKQGTGDPPVGEPIEGEFSEKKPGDWRFRKASKPQGGGSNGGGGKASNWQPEQERDPERSARILRQHSQEMAVRVLTAMGAFDGKHGETIHSTLKSWVEWFDQDVRDAGQKAVQGLGSRALGGVQAESGPTPAQPPASDERDLYQLLEAAGLNAVAARVVCDYVNDAFTPEQRETAIHRLNDPNQQVGALNKLKELTVKATGEPLPEEVPYDDEIPF